MSARGQNFTHTHTHTGKKKPASKSKKSMDTIDHADIEMKVIFKASRSKTKHLSVESLKRPGCTL